MLNKEVALKKPTHAFTVIVDDLYYQMDEEHRKTSNIREMCYWLERGYKVDDSTSKDHATNLTKFEALNEVFRGKVVDVVYDRFTRSLDVFSRGI